MSYAFKMQVPRLQTCHCVGDLCTLTRAPYLQRKQQNDRNNVPKFHFFWRLQSMACLPQNQSLSPSVFLRVCDTEGTELAVTLPLLFFNSCTNSWLTASSRTSSIWAFGFRSTKFPESSWQSSFCRLSNSPEPPEYSNDLSSFPMPLAGHNGSSVPSKSRHFSSRETRRTPLTLLWTPANAECRAMCHPCHNFSFLEPPLTPPKLGSPCPALGSPWPWLPQFFMFQLTKPIKAPRRRVELLWTCTNSHLKIQGPQLACGGSMPAQGSMSSKNVAPSTSRCYQSGFPAKFWLECNVWGKKKMYITWYKHILIGVVPAQFHPKIILVYQTHVHFATAPLLLHRGRCLPALCWGFSVVSGLAGPRMIQWFGKVMLYKHPPVFGPGLRCMKHFEVHTIHNIHMYIYKLCRHTYIFYIYIYFIYINGMCISQPASKTCERYSGRTCMPTLGATLHKDIQVTKGKVQMKGTKWNWWPSSTMTETGMFEACPRHTPWPLTPFQSCKVHSYCQGRSVTAATRTMCLRVNTC